MKPLVRPLLRLVSIFALAWCPGCDEGRPQGDSPHNAEGSANQPEAPPPAWPPANLQVMRFVNFGDLDSGGAKDLNAWRSIGVNLDGVAGEAAASPRCQPQPGISLDVQQRGVDGIENSFGHNVVPILGGPDTPLSVSITNSIGDGDETFLFAFYDFPMSPDHDGLRTGLLQGVAPGGVGGHLRPAPSAWEEGNTVWDLPSTALASTSPIVPRILVNGSLRANHWESERHDLLMFFSLKGISVPVSLHRGSLRGTFSPDHRALHGGVLAGLLSIEEWATGFAQAAPRISTSFCSPSSVDFITTTVFRSATDMLLDGTQDPDRPCDAISFGMGFEAVVAQPGQLALPPPAGVSPCDPTP